MHHPGKTPGMWLLLMVNEGFLCLHKAVNCCVPFAGTNLHTPGEGGCLKQHRPSVKQQEGEFSVLCVAEVIYHTESATQEKMRWLVQSLVKKEKPLPSKAAVKLFGLQKAHGGM